jgi:DNA-binding response OmpR family regulator
MASSQANQQPLGRSESSPFGLIVYVAGESDVAAFHAASLRAAGYTFLAALTADDALRCIEKNEADVIIVGHDLPFAQRMQVEEAVCRLARRPRIVLLYDTSISQTEQADAVLSVHSEPQHLVQTIGYLLTGAD